MVGFECNEEAFGKLGRMNDDGSCFFLLMVVHQDSVRRLTCDNVSVVGVRKVGRVVGV